VLCLSADHTVYANALTTLTAHATTHVGLLTVVPNVANAQMFEKSCSECPEQLGDGTTSYATTPIKVAGLEDTPIADISAGGWHSLALTTAGGALS
jgi:Regulator of chromosome condensation (RCC1) repeat